MRIGKEFGTMPDIWALCTPAVTRSRFISLLGQVLVPLVFVIIGGWTMASGAENPNGRPANHLKGVQSPYLQQHLYNVVDWYPWGEAALAKAKQENKPIFLSVGYSTCHWCHVMARESFEDEQIGAFLNEHFISIKVDRERRPDLDEQYMLATQMITGGGGWPNSVFLSPDGKPFFAGTYFPPQVFMRVLGQVNDLWRNENADVLAESERVGGILAEYLQRTLPAKALTPEAIHKAALALMDEMDEFNGGFEVAPKFPQESALLFMLDQAERHRDRTLLDAVTMAMDGMLKGGIHDQVGGGFHRYSVDAEWHVPHFEKMLYNQALIGRIATKLWLATGEIRYRYTAERVLDFVLRELTDAKGAFYSALDADSRNNDGTKGEGYFYIWSPDEIKAVLGDQASSFLNAYNVTPGGNFEGANVLHMSELPAKLAHKSGLSEIEYLNQNKNLLEKLYKEREKRNPPHRDEKILVSWNGTMIETLVLAAGAFERSDYLDAAQKSADFVINTMMHDDGIDRVSFEGGVGVEGQLPDYAAFGLALIALSDSISDTEGSEEYLAHAETIADWIEQKFASGEIKTAALAMNHKMDGFSVLRPIDDGEIPSGNSLALALFAKLAKRSENPKYGQKASVLASILSASLLETPISRGYGLIAAMIHSHGEADEVRSLASGAVKIHAVRSKDRKQLDLTLRIKKGWHINANKPLQDYLIGTQLSLGDQELDDGGYPNPVIKSLKFNDKPMSLYEDTLALQLDLADSNTPQQAKLKLQACSDQICLPPEEVFFTIW